MQVRFLQALPLPTRENQGKNLGQLSKIPMLQNEHLNDFKIVDVHALILNCKWITSLCVGINFHGIPSATSALNCTTTSLQGF